MHRFYVALQNISGDKIIIADKQQAHHIRDVLRLKPKEKVVLFDPAGSEYDCQIENLSAQITLKIIQKRLFLTPERKMQITLACAIPQNVKMDEIVDKLTQLGIDRIIPLETERTIVKLDDRKKSARLERWRKIALAAAQQSQQRKIPEIEPIMGTGQALIKCQGADLKLVAHLAGKRKSLKEVLREGPFKRMAVFIGPEGDFTPEEVELAKKAGFIPVTLGDLVLRVDTAAIAVASFIQLYVDH